ncbi:MAG: hypothetical protein ACK6CT_12870 [Planctomycetia bacterium]|jgi:hypothetical protein
MAVVVLGLAAYPANRVWPNVELLVRSVKRNSCGSDVALLTSRLGQRDRRMLARYAVRAFEVVDDVPRYNSDTAEGRAAFHRWSLEMFGKRQRMYLEAIERLPHTHVLLSDTRDVLVTGDLNRHVAAETLVLSQEDEKRSISEEPWNRKWILEGYGEEELARIGLRPILCAGAVFGPRAAVASYVRAMSLEVDRVGVEATRKIGDQPLHNHLAYARRLPDFVVSRAEDGWLRSIGVLSPAAVNPDWTLPRARAGCHTASVVHQYDRHLKNRAVRQAVGDMAGLGAMHPWRIHAFQEHGSGLVARILRKVYWHVPLLRR